VSPDRELSHAFADPRIVAWAHLSETECGQAPRPRRITQLAMRPKARGGSVVQPGVAL